MNFSLNQSVFTESPSLRTSAISNLNNTRAQEILSSEAHLNIPDNLSIVDHYNSGQMQTDFNIFQVDFESISATIVQQP